MRAPWEVAAHGGSPRDLADRARQAQHLLGRRGSVAAYGPAGFTVRTPTGATTVHQDLDGLLDRLHDLSHPAVLDRATSLDVTDARRSVVARAYRERHGPGR
ncbi:hypothetical protein [Nocardioides aurantiacus]|uniref:Uncharacterized protein n=1 Tax=Nocardioides aurantiacus TaxID=86796 RepID=A0A3N2CZI0_9ACTN|nr:hypothetical protein [Nocardioides aurantiacus]ROR92883.1 hypothetical protein EDD33_3784 [Nocardioides aurantiacus]